MEYINAMRKKLEEFITVREQMYAFCDLLKIANMDEQPEGFNMSIRDVLKQELIRMGTFIIVDNGQTTKTAVDALNELTDSELSVADVIDLDRKNRIENAYVDIPLNIEISIKYEAELTIMQFFEGFGVILAEIGCDLQDEYMQKVYIYLGYLQKCLDRTAYGSLQKYSSSGTEWYEYNKRGTTDSDKNKNRKNAFRDKSGAENKSYEELLAELDSLIGLDNVKQEVRTMANLVRIGKIRESRGLDQPERSLHMIFSGNPGTGKTTVARLIARIYQALGVLSSGHLVETDCSGLVAGYVGQTALKTAAVIEEAMGGVLFIDEAYALANKGSDNDFGQEAIETVLKAMEDNREDFVVIAAGYTDLMEKFINSNPGLRSRFTQTLVFEDYDGKQLYDIFCKMCNDAKMTMTADADENMKTYFADLFENRDENFANARDVRNIFEKVLARQANRLAVSDESELSDEMLMEICAEDTCF